MGRGTKSEKIKTAQQKISESESRLRALFENVEGFTCLLDTQKRLVIFNQRFAEGYKILTNKEPVSGEEMYSYLPPYEKKRRDEILDKVLMGKKESIETEYEKNGRRIFLKTSFNPVIIEGEVTGISVYVVNQTESKETQIQTFEAEAKFKNLVENSMEGVYIIQNDKFRYVNPKFAEIFGYNQEELIDSSVEVVVAEEDRKTVLDNIRNHLKGEKVSIHYEVRGKKKNGRLIHVEVLGTRTQYEGKPAIIGSLIDITERKIAQEQIIKEKNLSDNIINSLPGIFSLRNKNGKYLRWNKHFETVTGYNTDEIKGMHPLDFIDIDEKELVRKKIEETIIEGSTEVELVIITKLGKKVPYYFSSKLVQYEGEPCIITQGLDISARKKTEDALKESEQKYRGLIEQAADAIFLADEKTNFIDVNTSACQLLGYSREELLKMKIQDAYFAEDLKKNPLPFDSLFAHKALLSEQKLKKKDGEAVPVEINAKLLDDGRIQAIVRDITERKKAEEALQKSEANLHTILDTTDSAYILIDKKLRIISFNQSAANIVELELGWQAKAGDCLINYLSEDRRQLTEKIMHDVLQGKHINYETSYSQPDGSIHWYDVRLFPISNSQNKIFGIVLATSNITDRKNAELHKEKITSDLMQRNKDLEQFAYIVSHNLRAPVASMLGISEILHSKHVTREEKSQLEQFLYSAAGKLDEIIKDLNHVLQVKREITEMKELVHFSQLVEDIKSSIQNLIKKENVQIKTDFSAIDELNTFKSYLHSIFYNLISNSIKFKQTTKKQLIELKSERTEDKIKLTFKDQGIGIDLEKHGEQLFGLYNRFHPNVEGKGMGLFMVKTQVETLGGTISVKSQPNVGTEFIIEFPCEN